MTCDWVGKLMICCNTHRTHGRNEARRRPGQEASLALPYSTLMSFGSKCTLLKKVLVTLLSLFGASIVIWRPGIAPPYPLVTPLTTPESC